MKPIPEVGKTYKFYDDGKIRESRQYNATVLRVITPEEAKHIQKGNTNLYDIWKNAIKTHTCGKGAKHIHFNDDGSITMIKEGEPWLYAEDTDYFVECSVPNYDKHNLWFVRTIWGEWFSMNVEDCWMGGLLDVDNTLTESLQW